MAYKIYRVTKAASKGIKAFWDNLKNDPDAYKVYMEKRTKSLMQTIKRKSDEDPHL